MDSTTMNDDEDMFHEMRLLSRLHRLPIVRSFDTSPLSSEEVFQLATVNGAKALGLPGSVGALRVGGVADIVLLRADKVGGVDQTDGAATVLDRLVYRASSSDVDVVIVGGRTVVEEGRLVFHDEASLIAALQNSAREVPQANRQWRELLRQLCPYVDGYWARWPTPEPAPDLLRAY
jgi:cytosine/adenosine deaminase-related metal-dependent hydrolase